MATNDVLQIHIPSGRWYNKKTGNVIYSTPSDDDYQSIYVCGSCYTMLPRIIREHRWNVKKSVL